MHRTCFLNIVEELDVETTEIDDDEQDLRNAGFEPEESSDSEYEMLIRLKACFIHTSPSSISRSFRPCFDKDLRYRFLDKDFIQESNT
uniref:Uncharacterized protein n=1 Tax=Romanomermis culicivorax TaxID=13658 RepID=A0A915L672_ROMCU